ncbi:hypothetical protein YC2023_098386 [Brassica napus]
MDHINMFEELVSFILNEVPEDHHFCKLFPYTLAEDATSWFKKLPPGSLTAWNDIVNAFVKKFLYDAAAKLEIEMESMIFGEPSRVEEVDISDTTSASICITTSSSINATTSTSTNSTTSISIDNTTSTSIDSTTSTSTNGTTSTSIDGTTSTLTNSTTSTSIDGTTSEMIDSTISASIDFELSSGHYGLDIGEHR